MQYSRPLMNLKRNKRAPLITFLGLLIFVMIGCGGTQQTIKRSAIETLERSIDHAANATISTSTDVDRNIGVLAWDNFTLPVFSANGLHVAVQLGSIPSIKTLVGHNNRPVESISIDRIGGHSRRVTPSTMTGPVTLMCPYHPFSQTRSFVLDQYRAWHLLSDRLYQY